MSDEADRTLRVVDFMPFEEHQLVTRVTGVTKSQKWYRERVSSPGCTIGDLPTTWISQY